MTAEQKCILGCWITFVAYWTVNAFSVKGTTERQSWSGILASRFLLLPGGFLLFWPKPPYPLGVRCRPASPVIDWLGVAVCILGLGIAIWSRRTLGRNWSSLVQLKQDHELIQSGPYRFVRHPIYTGILALCLGSAISAGRVASGVGFLLLTLGFWIKLRQEETLLVRHFPAEYPAYASRVKALIPFVF